MNNQSNQLIVNMFRDSPWPGNILSNFAKTPFVIDKVKCACSEAFIQSLKFQDPEEQIIICGLSGQEVWERGSKETDGVFLRGNVWWLGECLKLHSVEHFELIERGLVAKFTQSDKARNALIGSGTATLTHDFGKPKGSKHSLPIEVFCQVVTKIRGEI